MKRLLLSLCAILLCASAFARGFDDGNAGDAFSAEFLYSGRDVLQRLELLAASGTVLVDTQKLRTAMEQATVVSDERVFLNGLERDAVNFPAKHLIKISRVRWRELRQTPETKARLTLVLHEFLWLADIPDTNFKASGPIIEKLNIAPYSPSIWLTMPGLKFATAECTGRDSDGTFVTVVVNTKGVTKAPDRGEVQIEKGRNTFGYRFSSEEISQFFEFDEPETNWATVGLGAYVGREFPIAVKYDGPNYVDQDLKVVIEIGANIPSGKTSGHNFMRIWKGPGFKATEQFVLKNPVCAISSEN